MNSGHIAANRKRPFFSIRSGQGESLAGPAWGFFPLVWQLTATISSATILARACGIRC